MTPAATPTATLARPARLVRIGTGSLVEVVLDAMPACERCAKGRGCGIAIVPPGTEVRLTCKAPEDRSLTRHDIGTSVQVEFVEPDASWLLPFSLACGLPTLGLVCGTLLGGVPGGVAGLAGGLLAWHRLSVRLEHWLLQRPCIGQARIARTDTTQPPAA